MRAIVAFNPAAGKGDLAAADLVAALATGGVTCDGLATSEAEFGEVLRRPADLIVAAGGDGTVVKVIRRLADRRIPLAIVPLGGANNVARSFGITGEPLEIARAGWRDARERRLDVGIATGPWGEHRFIESVGVGALAEAAASVKERGITGPEKSGLARQVFMRLLAEAEPQDLRLRIDGQELAVPCLLAEIMNMPSTGPHLRLAPEADPGDGLLDLAWLAREDRATMLAWIESDRAAPPPTNVRRGRTFGFDWRAGRIHVGDLFPLPTDGTVEVRLLPEPVTVLVAPC